MLRSCLGSTLTVGIEADYSVQSTPVGGPRFAVGFEENIEVDLSVLKSAEMIADDCLYHFGNVHHAARAIARRLRLAESSEVSFRQP